MPKYGPKYGIGSFGPRAFLSVASSEHSVSEPSPDSSASAARVSTAFTTTSLTRAQSGSSLDLKDVTSDSADLTSPSPSGDGADSNSCSAAAETLAASTSSFALRSPNALNATWPYAAISSASALPWSFFRFSKSSTVGNTLAASARLSSLLDFLCANPRAFFHACGFTTLTCKPAPAKTPFHIPKLYPCTKAVCAEKPYSTPPSSTCATEFGGSR